MIDSKVRCTGSGIGKGLFESSMTFVKCVSSDISCVRLNSRVLSVILLFAFFILKLKSPVIIMSIMFVLHALSIIFFQ